jgi:hypothetical protein
MRPDQRRMRWRILADVRVIFEHAVDALFNRTLGKRLTDNVRVRTIAADKHQGTYLLEWDE